MSENKTIKLSDLEARKGSPRQSFAEGRYVTTRSAPRSGGLSTVYQATDIETTSKVAMKVFRSEGRTDDVIEESFRREVQALSDLSHAHIVRILDSGRDSLSGQIPFRAASRRTLRRSRFGCNLINSKSR